MLRADTEWSLKTEYIIKGDAGRGEKKMNDLISRRAAIDAINEYCTSAPEYMQGWANKLIEAVKGDIAEIISELSAAHEWFSVDEARRRLVVGSRVLVYVGADKAVMKLQYIGNGRFWPAPELNIMIARLRHGCRYQSRTERRKNEINSSN